MAVTNADLYQAGMQAQLDVTTGGKKMAMFQGRKYETIDLPQLIKATELYRRMGIADGSIQATSATSPVTVSTVTITDPYYFS